MAGDDVGKVGWAYIEGTSNAKYGSLLFILCAIGNQYKFGRRGSEIVLVSVFRNLMRMQEEW